MTQEDNQSANHPMTLQGALAAVLREEGFDAADNDDGKVVLGNGVTVHVEFQEQVTLGDGRLRTATRTLVCHPTLFPAGLAEFQHATGRTSLESVQNGFRTWAQTDLATIMGATDQRDDACLVMSMSFPATETSPPHPREVYMGPYVHHATQRQAEQAGDEDCEDGECHSFCPCCLFTNSIDAFTDLLKSDRLVGVRLFASRDDNGEVSADCRINGEDFPAGAEQLRQYAKSWPEQGFEFRKQYVVIRSPGHAAD